MSRRAGPSQDHGKETSPVARSKTLVRRHSGRTPLQDPPVATHSSRTHLTSVSERKPFVEAAARTAGAARIENFFC